MTFSRNTISIKETLHIAGINRENKGAVDNLQTDEPSDTEQVLLMGNPVENNATVLFNTSPCDEVSVRVLDMKGRQVLTKKFAKTCLNTFSLTTTSLPRGMYLLEVLWKQNRKTLKIVKQ